MAVRTQATKRLKEMPCTDCGKPITVGKNRRKAVLCLPCGIKRAAENNRQLHEKSGPEYEKWLNATKAGLERYISTTLAPSANKNGESDHS